MAIFLLNREDIVPNINNGFEKWVNINAFDASISVIIFLFSNSFMYFELLGNPDNMLMMNINDTLLLIPNRYISGLNKYSVNSTKP